MVGLVMMDLRARGKVGRLVLCGVDGRKFPDIRAHLKRSIGDVYGLDTAVETFPRDGTVNPEAYLDAIATCSAGDVAIVFTPDDTHHRIALACINHGIHVLVTKPIVKTLLEHIQLLEAATKNKVLVAIEVHKRWDPMYVDARDRIRQLGDFSFVASYMSQPKQQLETFRAWAGKSSDMYAYFSTCSVYLPFV